MNPTTWKRIASLPAALLALVLVSGVVRADADDAWLTSKVKLALLTSQDVHGSKVDVDVDHGIVTLSGRVRSDAERERAEAIASRTGGVRSVSNNLDVAPDDNWRVAEVSDQHLKTQVRDALHHAHLRDQYDTRVEVKSVHNGVVRLGGRAGSLDDQLRAVQVCSSVAGVRGVVDDIHAPDRVAAWETPTHRSHAHGHDAYDTRYDASTGSSSNDAWISGQIKSRYLANTSFPSAGIEVETRDGMVVLHGTVPDRDAADDAESIARSVSGVRSVRSQLTISGADNDAYDNGASDHNGAYNNDTRDDNGAYRDDSDHLTDAELEQAIRNRIERAELDADIRVKVHDGVAHLTGSYDRAEDRYEAVRIARGMAGVVRVQDDLKPARRD